MRKLTPGETFRLNQMLDELESVFTEHGVGPVDLATRQKTRDFMFHNFEECILSGVFNLRESPQLRKKICDTCGKIIWGTSCPCAEDENQEREI